jgi:hypothetical protein
LVERDLKILIVQAFRGTCQSVENVAVVEQAFRGTCQSVENVPVVEQALRVHVRALKMYQ